MADIAVRADCAHHPTELAVAICDRCGRPLCAACRTDGIHVDGEFCSAECRDAAETAGADALLEGLEHPFTTGWALWRRSATALLRDAFPVAVIITAGFALDAWLNPLDPLADPADATLMLPATLMVFGGLVLGIVVVQSRLSKEYTGIIRGNVYLWSLRRLVPWGLTWLLMVVAVSLGFLALIVPGIILSLRLFWADEFALAHRCDPVTSLRESWRLTSGWANNIFVFQLLAGLAAWAVVLAGALTAGALQAVLLQLGAAGGMLLILLIVLLILVGYGAVHAPEVAKFYGMRAAQIKGIEPGQPVRLGLSHRRRATA